MGYKAGLLSTVCNYIDAEAVPKAGPLPDQLTISALLRRMVDNGCLCALYGVSSHAAHQHRIAGLHFTGGIFPISPATISTTIRQSEAYLQAKNRFFDDLPSTAFALTSADDKTGQVMLQNTLAKNTHTLRACVPTS